MDDDEPIRGQVRLSDHRRVSHGLFLRSRDGLSDDEELHRDLRAWRLVLPPDAVFTHVTAARLLGWRLPHLPDQVPVFAAVQGEHRPRRPGLICSRLVRTSEAHVVHGLPVDTAPEVLLRAARDLGTLDLVIMLDSALELGHLVPADLEALLESKRPGVAPLRAAYGLATPRCESAGETVLRLFHCVMEIAVEPQVVLRDAAGRRIGRADLLVSGTWDVHEYDGAGHRDGTQHRIDLRRERGWAGTPYTRRGFTLDDLLQHPGVVMHELDRALDRPHQVRRLRAWRRLVDNSLYREPGRARVLNRWRRQMGVVDWAGTA
ncbi:hypothetical protein [uncultured Nocardioides sp.]|uniref:hypothetical protein n=1 Tax=uncultured Nocardioides sp. TaxID=198441 RepID=UPI0025EF79FD|nr:hypothetical protein [uncultured Nocardioides sp.]